MPAPGESVGIVNLYPEKFGMIAHLGLLTALHASEHLRH